MEKHMSMINSNPALRRRVIGWGLVATLATIALVGIATQGSAEGHRALAADPSSAAQCLTRRRLPGHPGPGFKALVAATVFSAGIVPMAITAYVATTLTY